MAYGDQFKIGSATSTRGPNDRPAPSEDPGPDVNAGVPVPAPSPGDVPSTEPQGLADQVQQAAGETFKDVGEELAALRDALEHAPERVRERILGIAPWWAWGLGGATLIGLGVGGLVVFGLWESGIGEAALAGYVGNLRSRVPPPERLGSAVVAPPAPGAGGHKRMVIDAVRGAITAPVEQVGAAIEAEAGAAVGRLNAAAAAKLGKLVGPERAAALLAGWGPAPGSAAALPSNESLTLVRDLRARAVPSAATTMVSPTSSNRRG